MNLQYVKFSGLVQPTTQPVQPTGTRTTTRLSAAAAYSSRATRPARGTTGPANGARTLPFGRLHSAKLQRGSISTARPTTQNDNRHTTQPANSTTHPVPQHNPTGQRRSVAIANTNFFPLLFSLQRHNNKQKIGEQVFGSWECLPQHVH